MWHKQVKKLSECNIKSQKRGQNLKQTSLFFKNIVPPWRVQKVLYFSSTLLLYLANPQYINTSWYIIFGSSSGNHMSFSASTNKTNLLFGCCKMCEVKLDLFSSINNFTLRTTLFSSLLTSKICLNFFVLHLFESKQYHLFWNSPFL